MSGDPGGGPDGAASSAPGSGGAPASPASPAVPGPSPAARARAALAGVGAARLGLGAVGLLGVAYGGLRILTQPERSHPASLAVWFAVAVAVHDGLLAPVVIGVGAVLAVVLPPRARRAAQGFLVAAALVTAVTVPLLVRRGSAPAAKALLDQDYRVHLLAVLGVLAAGAVAAWAVEVVADRRRARRRRSARAGGDPGGEPAPRPGPTAPTDLAP